MAFEEKRRFVRIDSSLNVKCKIKDGEPITFETISRNISRGGLRVSASRPVDVGKNVDLEIYIPEDKEPVLASAKIVWMQEVKREGHPKQYDLGLELIKVDSSYRDRLLRYAFGQINRILDKIAAKAKANA